MMPEKIFQGINVFVLMAIPFFMLAGEVMNKTGVSDRLITFSNLVIGRVRGGLAQVNVLASILFAGITGVALGDIAALGSVFVPAMEKQGYDKPFSAAVTAASSLCGPIIPPSTIIVLYGAVMGVSVGAMFAGAIIPGILIGLSDMLIVKILAEKRQYPKIVVKVTPRSFFLSLKDAILALIMPVIIIGGILFGIFTPTEAAAVSVLYALIIGFFIFRTLKTQHLFEILATTVLSSAKLFFIIAGAAVVSWVFGIENIPVFAENAFLTVSQNEYILIFMINLFFLFMGTWMDPGASIILFAPVLAPMAMKLGINPIQFGIMIIINSNIGLCTPPVGNVLFAISDMSKLDIFKVGKELMPFLAINFAIILLVGYVPQLSLFLPKLLGFID
jgi:tripartite ATP-independent transporter DctM subunit